jgi:hypothetical protein
MQNKFAPFLTFNVIIAVLFVISSFYVWDFINLTDTTLGATQVSINPLVLEITHHVNQNGMINLGPLPTVIPNYPFILFLIATVGNTCFFYLAIRKKEPKPNPA